MTHTSSLGTLQRLETLGTIGAINAGTIDRIVNITSVNTLGTLQRIETLGTIGAINAGTLGELIHVSNLGTLTELSSLKSGTVSLFATAGSALTPSGRIDVLSTNTAILAQNASRFYASIQNLAGTPVYIALGGVSGTERGIRIGAAGGIYEINQVNLWRGSVNGITAGASGTSSVSITEW